MRCFIHDFAGHPFQVQLSRELAARGHQVTHAFPTGLQGPKGRLQASEEDPPSFQIRAIPLSGSFRKYSPHRRFISQRHYAQDLKQILKTERPDVVLSGNTPIDVQVELLWYCRRHKIAFIHWVQDVYCHALEFFLRRKLGSLAGLLSKPFVKLEQSVASGSDGVIVISPAFKTLLSSWGIPEDKITVLENWAPLEEMPSHPRVNGWAQEHGLDGQTVFLYSGTLGLKHRPDLLYRLAQSLGDAAKVVVISEGVGREYLDRQPSLPNLSTFNFQPYHRLPEVLASADVLVATLESDAGQFAVPSKILTYLCAGRSILLAAPRNNLACSVIERSGSGIIADADNPEAWLAAAQKLASDKEVRAQLARNARTYAEETFDIQRVASRFEEVLITAFGGPPALTPSGLTPSGSTPSVQPIQTQTQI